MRKKAIIIGAGISGIATAIRLATKGFEVTVFEKNSLPGGKAGLLQKQGFTFDTGPSLFTQPGLLEELFTSAGKSLSDYLSYNIIDTGCTYYFSSGKKLSTTHVRETLLNNFQEQLNEPKQNIESYLEYSKLAYQHIGKVFLENDLHKWSTWFSKQIFPALKNTRWQYLFQNMHAYHTSCFQQKETVQLFDRFATYNGSSPYKAPAMLSMIPHIELNEGVFYPQGGIAAVLNAMYTLALEFGVTFIFNSLVQNIVVENDVVKGVTVDGTKRPADVVVSNADVHFTYQRLLKEPVPGKEQALSSSAMVFYWGIQQKTELGLHNIIFSDDYRQEFSMLFDEKNMSSNPTVYINITSKMESNMAPEGAENWFVMVNAPASQAINWSEVKQRVKQQIINLLKNVANIDISDSIIFEEVLTPEQLAINTNSYKGALYGPASNKKMAAFLRHRNQHKKYSGLFFCGGTVHPGGGIPLCLHSAAITSKLILAQ